uniref:Cerebellar degeneration-related protein 2-like n=1 Tax=Glossina morsitans morsitans TaxID=37546 RepID=A0A1B0G5R8_GLOMM
MINASQLLENDIYNYNSIEDNLQLAAELGKTLLERNKELETLLKEYKHTIEEQEQEIVYLKKHTTALREVNDSRLKVYEQLEVGIQELERANHRLLVENTSDKKHIKTLSNNIETLEGRCEELTKQLEEVRQALTAERRKNERFLAENIKTDSSDMTVVKLKHTSQKECNEGTADATLPVNYDPSATAPENFSFTFQSPVAGRNANSTSIISGDGGGDQDNSFNLHMACSSDGSDEIIKLVNDLESTKRAFMTEQQRCSELEEQLVAIIQENQTLQGRIAQSSTTEEMRSMHDELSVLDEVRQGQMCSRCLRSMDDRITFNDEQSSMAPTEECEEDEERSLLGLESNRDDNASEHSQAEYRPSMTIKVIPQIPDSLDLHAPGSPNPYRDLVEKYEALLEVQRSSLAHKANNGMSLAEELQSSGEFNQAQKRMFQEAGGGHRQTAMLLVVAMAAYPMPRPVMLRPIRIVVVLLLNFQRLKLLRLVSRMKQAINTRKLMIGQAAENKEEGEKLPLLDDTHPTSSVAVAPSKVPPVTPANEELPVDFGDDSQSVISSAISEQSFAMSECITKLERKTAKKHINEKNQENKPPIAASISQLASPNVKQIVENGRVLTPLKREPLDYLSVEKNRRKNRNFSNDRSESPLALPTPPRIYVGSGKKRREMRPFVDTSTTSGSPSEQSQNNSTCITSRGSRNGAKYEWNGNSMIIYNRSIRGRNSVDASAGIEYRPSTVSQDLHKLKKLDLSYAEVLRRADACNQHHQQQQQLRRRNHHRH